MHAPTRKCTHACTHAHTHARTHTLQRAPKRTPKRVPKRAPKRKPKCAPKRAPTRAPKRVVTYACMYKQDMNMAEEYLELKDVCTCIVKRPLDGPSPHSGNETDERSAPVFEVAG